MPEASENLKNVQFLRGQRGARAAAHRLNGFAGNAADESATQLNATAEIYRTVDDVPNTRPGALCPQGGGIGELDCALCLEYIDAAIRSCLDVSLSTYEAPSLELP